ncbi:MULTISPECIES: DHH family phosphoesterase [Halolamina]|uniref:NanoRNase/pAp phosphatase, hydrolyzes c-di-AMP and oligoRNAs n=1 Tax=Halolamina pelagica TaxID=699431 RepID=A0A1I5NLX3_9EURY|nr:MULTISPECIES: DHH family phosphoesterase [Halolamina]NHX36384.1 bifunctional oligoribonuclease/PAP phosphatase NrnA [Halolamina sp. R1-12]SFP22805.1 nanoRNase/pAp phosphatase, hydrolyzes c-di-AMP and oligoRNAs [Halolamina pelagica]
MVTRLVLGCGAVGFDLLQQLPDRETTVVTDDEPRAESLREASIAAVEGDPTDPRAHAPDADIVLVASDDPERNLTVAEAARETFPDAMLIAYAGEGALPATVDAIRAVADRVVDPTTELADRVLDRTVGFESDRARGLRRALLDAAEPIAVVTHDNPDPDAIASAVALCRLADRIGVEAEACYHGEISHQENRALVNLLDLPLVRLDPGDIGEYGGIALVDHSRPGVNDSLPEDTEVDIVVDHHPPRGPVDGAFVDLRSGVGATSTLLTEYLDRFDVSLDTETATALLYGIRIDTKEFTREASKADFAAAASLIPDVDAETLSRIESPSISLETVSVLASAIENRTVRDHALSTCVGEIRDRDALAQAAERLLDMEGVRITLVYGFKDETIYVSGRSRGSDLDLGETLRDAFGAIGDAGGHADMAGAQIPLGILGAAGPERTGSLAEIVREVVGERFFDALSDAPDAPVADETLEYDYAPEGAASIAVPSGNHDAEADDGANDAGTDANGSTEADADTDDPVGGDDTDDA